MKTPVAVFFDLDGTLIDSIELIIQCFQHATQEHLGYSLERDKILALIGKPLRPELERLSPGNCEALVATYRDLQFSKHGELVKPFEHIAEMLTTLRDLPLPTGIVTSKARRGTLEALKLFGEAALHLDILITVDDCQNHKPHPEPLLTAASRANVHPRECWYVGDTIFDMEAAHAAEMTPIGVTWGVATRETLLRYTPHVFDTVHDLKDFIIHPRI